MLKDSNSKRNTSNLTWCAPGTAGKVSDLVDYINLKNYVRNIDLDSEAPFVNFFVILLEIDKAGMFDYDKCQLDTIPNSARRYI